MRTLPHIPEGAELAALKQRTCKLCHAQHEKKIRKTGDCHTHTATITKTTRTNRYKLGDRSYFARSCGGTALCCMTMLRVCCGQGPQSCTQPRRGVFLPTHPFPSRHSPPSLPPLPQALPPIADRVGGTVSKTGLIESTCMVSSCQ